MSLSLGHILRAFCVEVISFARNEISGNVDIIRLFSTISFLLLVSLELPAIIQITTMKIINKVNMELLLNNNNIP